MRAPSLVLGLTIFGASGCASSASLPSLGAVESQSSNKTHQPSLAELGVDRSARMPADPPAPKPRKAYADLERQLRLIADRQLDVARGQIEELFAELRAERLLSQNALSAAAQNLDRQRELQASRERAELALRSMAGLAGLATVGQDSRGTVITLSCRHLFQRRQSALSPVAKAHLAEITRATAELISDGSILIEVDAVDNGPAAPNLELSQQRALAIRSYLIERGVAANRITALGRPASRTSPISSDDAQLEIVLGAERSRVGGVAQP